MLTSRSYWLMAFFVFMFRRKLDLDKCGSERRNSELESVKFDFPIKNVSPNGIFLKETKYLLTFHYR